MLLIAGVVFTALTLYALRGGLVGKHGLTVVGFDIESLAMGALAIILAAHFFGPLFGLALIFSVIIHEFGHVAAFRVAGHSDARFRLVPLMGGYAISDTLPATQKKDFFITLMGPGISLAPMILAFGLSEYAWEVHPLAGQFLSTFGYVTASLNFLNLMPFWPLDGGRCVRIIAYTFWPGMANMLTILMSAALAAIAVFTQHWFLLFFAVLGAQSLMHVDTISRAQARMSWSDGLFATGAYLFTAAAHLWGGWWLLARYL